jgi:hypothetical protein
MRARRKRAGRRVKEKREENREKAKERQEMKEGNRSCFRYTMKFSFYAWCHSL